LRSIQLPDPIIVKMHFNFFKVIRVARRGTALREVFPTRLQGGQNPLMVARKLLPCVQGVFLANSNDLAQNFMRPDHLSVWIFVSRVKRLLFLDVVDAVNRNPNGTNVDFLPMIGCS
jgi:hypothetical protein